MLVAGRKYIDVLHSTKKTSATKNHAGRTVTIPGEELALELGTSEEAAAFIRPILLHDPGSGPLAATAVRDEHRYCDGNRVHAQ